MRITLDAETFRALASTTRLAVLKALDERRKTLSELARDLMLNKATVHEHLQLLSAAELVKKRDDEGRKWIYYELTWRGQKILHPQETTTFNVLLGLSIVAAGGGAALLVQALLAANERAALRTTPELEANDTQMAGAAMAPEAASASGPSNASASSAPASGTASPAAGAPGAATSSSSSAPLLDANKASDAGVDDSGLLDESGWLALAVLASGLLFGLLATLLRRRLRPKKAEAPGLE